LLSCCPLVHDRMEGGAGSKQTHVTFWLRSWLSLYCAVGTVCTSSVLYMQSSPVPFCLLRTSDMGSRGCAIRVNASQEIPYAALLRAAIWLERQAAHRAHRAHAGQYRGTALGGSDAASRTSSLRRKGRARRGIESPVFSGLRGAAAVAPLSRP
jgi:hypothetical protein